MSWTTDVVFMIMGGVAIWGLSAIFEQLEDIKKLLLRRFKHASRSDS